MRQGTIILLLALAGELAGCSRAKRAVTGDNDALTDSRQNLENIRKHLEQAGSRL